MDLLPVNAAVEALPDQYDWLIGWLEPKAQWIAASVANGGAIAIGQPDVRGVPLRAAASWRAERLLMRAFDSAETLPTEARPGTPGLTPREVRMTAVLQDACDYSHARAVGVSPAALIALRRGIATGSAEQRIVKARIAGFLSDGTSGELTEEARDLRSRVIRATTRPGKA